MIQLYDFLRLLPLYVFCFIGSFLFHELGHIKCSSLKDTGNIQVFRYGFAASRDNKSNDWWFFLAGGLLAGVLYITIGLLCWYDSVVQLCLFTAGIVNICYGPFEMYYLPRWGSGDKRYKYGRYSIYIIVTIVCLIMGVYLL